MQKEDLNKVVVFCTDGTNSRLLVDFLQSNFHLQQVYVEPAADKFKVVKRRIKNLGIFKASGQIAFQLLILPFIGGTKRRENLLEISQWKDKPISSELRTNINSINTVDLNKIIAEHEPDYVFINGTAIIAEQQLKKFKAPVLNIHVGITPAYRGVHGGYWAIKNQQKELFGTTLHLVDKGIDTGGILAQKVIKINAEDNFKTYPLIQFLGGIELIEAQLNELKKGIVKTTEPMTEDSQLYSHPTFFEYLIGRLIFGVK